MLPSNARLQLPLRASGPREPQAALAAVSCKAGLGGISYALYFSGQALKILLIRLSDEGTDAFVVLRGVEGLPPRNQGVRSIGLEFDREYEVMVGQVFNLDHALSHNSNEATLVRVVPPIWPVHGEEPSTAGFELELVNRVLESGWSPPPGDSGGITHGGVDLRDTRMDPLAAEIRSGFDRVHEMTSLE